MEKHYGDGLTIVRDTHLFCRSRVKMKGRISNVLPPLPLYSPSKKKKIHQDSYLPMEDYIPNQAKSQFMISIYYVRASDIH